MTHKFDDQPFYLCPENVGRSFSAAAPHYDENAVLARQVREQLIARLDYVALKPAVILDAGTATGESLAALRDRYADAELVAIDLADGMLALAATQAAAAGNARCIKADCHALPLAKASVNMVFSNLMLPWCHDPEAVLREFRRVLAPGGLLCFATCGPDTLRELRSAWALADGYNHVNYFYDMHDIGDALQRAGFAGPVMDVDYYTLTYPSAIAAMRDLKLTGARNVTSGQPRGLTGRARFARVIEAYEAQRVDGRVPATYEVIFGHAFAPDKERQSVMDDGAVGIPVSAIGRAS